MDFSSGDSAIPPVNIIFFLGAPGSGKGTQCHLLLSKKPGYAHLSAGELIRRERDTPGSTHGNTVKEAIKEPGKFVPARITVAILEREMEVKKPEANRGFLIDGFPINWDNLTAWNELMGEKTTVRSVIFIDTPEELCVKRCMSTRKREDDSEEVFRKRFVEFERQTMPVVKYYEKMGLLNVVKGAQEKQNVLEDILQVWRGE